MAVEDAESKILEYLKKEKHANTFRLARELHIDRHKLLNIIKKLEEKQAIEFKYGKVRFLKFPTKEKKQPKVEVKKAPEPEKEVKYKPKKTIQKKAIAQRKTSVLKNLQDENRDLKGGIEKLENTVKELRKKIRVVPKVITRTIIKKVSVRLKKEEPKKFKLPKFNLSWIKNIQQLEKPEFIEQKIRTGRKINFSELNKNIQQLHIPEILRNP